ncbi:MAG: bifunctional riboflavin kinase/FAD synthetase [Prevotellaceae bacterium]|nr:bifunctional riboflavin kinase/FAD synthetase [Prevotellaceae bacterium]
MNIVRDISTYVPRPAVATLGFFDGVHLGHRFLIERLKAEAQVAGLPSLLITFSPHPREVLRVDPAFRLLTTLDEKLAILDALGIDMCIVLPFNRELADYSAYDFLKEILGKHLMVNELLIGYDHRFGKYRSDGFEQYVKYGNELGIKVSRAERFTLDGVTISASAIRKLLAGGDVVQAEKMLGYSYSLEGVVVRGRQLGRTINFPTANLQLFDQKKMLPADGVYAVSVEAQGKTYEGILNIGTRPTVGNGALSVEAHILHFSEDIYGEKIRVHFHRFIRPEMKFGDLQVLKEQIEADIASL